MKKTKFAYLFVYIILLIVAFVTLLPILYTVFGSFKTNMEILSHPERLMSHEPTFDNYVQIFKSDDFNVGRMFLNSIMYSGFYVITSILISVMAAYAFARGKFIGKKTWFAIFTSMMFINLGSITVYPLFEILGKIHLSTSLYSLMVLQFFGINSIYIILIKSYIETLPKELDESARIDGCGVMRILFKIILPLLKPIIATITILSFQSSWNDYIMPQIFTASFPLQRTLTVGIVALKNSGAGASATNLMLAGAVFSILPVLIIYCACNKFFVSGLSAGAVKG